MLKVFRGIYYSSSESHLTMKSAQISVTTILRGLQRAMNILYIPDSAFDCSCSSYRAGDGTALGILLAKVSHLILSHFRTCSPNWRVTLSILSKLYRQQSSRERHWIARFADCDDDDDDDDDDDEDEDEGADEDADEDEDEDATVGARVVGDADAVASAATFESFLRPAPQMSLRIFGKVYGSLRTTFERNL